MLTCTSICLCFHHFSHLLTDPDPILILILYLYMYLHLNASLTALTFPTACASCHLLNRELHFFTFIPIFAIVCTLHSPISWLWGFAHSSCRGGYLHHGLIALFSPCHTLPADWFTGPTGCFKRCWLACFHNWRNGLFLLV